MNNWQPIETAPNDASILLAYDNETIDLIHAEDNDYTWQAHPGKRLSGIVRPTHWMPLPELPK